MKKSKAISITVTLLCLAGAGWAQGQAQNKGPRVVLEEEEITLFDDSGKELGKRYVGKNDVEKSVLVKQVREKVLKSMGLKSLADTKGRKELNQRYLNEQRKFIKIRELKPLTLKFVDKNKNVIKEVPICPPGSGCKSNITTMPMEYWQSMGIKVTADEIAQRKVEQRITREPTISKSQNAAVISEIGSEFAVPSSTQEALFAEKGGGELGTASSIEYYDEQGNMRWKKKSEKRNLLLYVGGLSEDGEIVAAIKRCEYGCRKLVDEGVSLQQLDVYNSKGEEILTLPLTKELCSNYGAGFWLSLDGNFIKFDCQPEKGWPKSILVNIKERKFWKAPYLIGIGRGDDGHEIREGNKLRVAITGDNELGSKSTELDLDQLSWQKLP